MPTHLLYQKGKRRDQLVLFQHSLEECIDADSMVRIVDLFVDRLSGLDATPDRYGFVVSGSNDKTGGNPSYAPSMMLKLYIYGYLNRIRSSRQLSRACKINVEVMWLLHQLTPNYHTIANFRKDNGKAIQQVFRLFNQFLLSQDMFGKEIIAIDGTKIRALNSKKNNYNQSKIDRQLEYVSQKTQEYLAELDRLDQEEALSEEQTQRQSEVIEGLSRMEASRAKYEGIQVLLDEQVSNGETQVSTTDFDSRALPEHMNIVHVNYNIQVGVDGANKLIGHFEVTNVHDTYALGDMACATATALGTTIEEEVIVLADAGYCTGSELQYCAENNVTTYVSPRDHATTKAEGYRKEDFRYESERDVYMCPRGEELRTNGQWYDRKNRKGEVTSRFKRYIGERAVCEQCPLYGTCVSRSEGKRYIGRTIERSEYDGALESNRDRIANNPKLYKLRQQLVEHPFGTIKRAWGYTYTLLKGKLKVATEMSLIFTAYNMRRSMSILGFQGLKTALLSWEPTEIS